jgi:hypothetical protein
MTTRRPRRLRFAVTGVLLGVGAPVAVSPDGCAHDGEDEDATLREAGGRAPAMSPIVNPRPPPPRPDDLRARQLPPIVNPAPQQPPRR